jgi:predicted nucleic acid-binding Zn ribbon protein
MLQQRICRQCGRSFEGGPRAYFCPSCRADRQREQWADYKRRQRKGDTRPIGSTDKCKRCGKDYTVNSGLQQYCPDCKPIHYAEHDRATSIDFYHSNKDRINPARYQRRRKPPKKCEWCGKEFETDTRTLTCSPECRKQLINKRWRQRYKKIRSET